MQGLTLDTGALIALERRDRRMTKVIDTATADRVRITVPAPALAEWWRGTSRRREAILAMFDVEPFDIHLARLTGEALATIAGATVVDAVVMASASRRGDVVYTSDQEDLVRLRAFFPNTRVLLV